MFKLRSLLVLLCLATTLTACTDDPVGVNSGDPLTEEEIQAVFFAISEAFASFEQGAAAAPGGPALVTVSVNESVSGTAQCEGGGSISGTGSASGSATDEPFEVDVAYRVRLDLSSCEVPTEDGSITLDSAPHIQLDMDFLLTETVIEVGGDQSGGIGFTSSDGRVGSCLFDVSFDVAVDLGAQSGSSQAAGTVCGVSVAGLQVFSVEAID